MQVICPLGWNRLYFSFNIPQKEGIEVGFLNTFKVLLKSKAESAQRPVLITYACVHRCARA